MLENEPERKSRPSVPAAVLVALALVTAGCGGGGGSQDNNGDRSNPGNRTAVDNTGINARDSSGTALTPTDQGGSEADRAVSQNIRKMLMASGLSSYAKNVKVITANGAVTLRGPVVSEEEKAEVERIARSVSGVVSVDNQLDVKSGS